MKSQERKRRTRKADALPFSALTRPEQLILEVLFNLNSAASPYEIYKMMAYRKFVETSLKNPDLTAANMPPYWKMGSALTDSYFANLEHFNGYLVKKELKLVGFVQYLNAQFAVGLPSYKTVEMLCEGFERSGWLTARKVPIQSRKGAMKVLYYLDEEARGRLKAGFSPKPLTSLP